MSACLPLEIERWPFLLAYLPALEQQLSHPSSSQGLWVACRATLLAPAADWDQGMSSGPSGLHGKLAMEASQLEAAHRTAGEHKSLLSGCHNLNPCAQLAHQNTQLMLHAADLSTLDWTPLPRLRQLLFPGCKFVQGFPSANLLPLSLRVMDLSERADYWTSPQELPDWSNTRLKNVSLGGSIYWQEFSGPLSAAKLPASLVSLNVDNLRFGEGRLRRKTNAMCMLGMLRICSTDKDTLLWCYAERLSGNWARLRSLEFLSARHCNMSGPLPTTLPPSIVELRLDANQFQGCALTAATDVRASRGFVMPLCFAANYPKSAPMLFPLQARCQLDGAACSMLPWYRLPATHFFPGKSQAPGMLRALGQMRSKCENLKFLLCA